MTAKASWPRFTPVAGHALLVEFGPRVTDRTRTAVRHLDSALALATPPGFAEAVPAGTSLLVAFDLLITDARTMEAALRAALLAPPQPFAPPRRHCISICHDADLAPDLDAVAAACGMTRDAVIAAHLAATFTVTMYGFAPGYAYLSGLPPALHLPRKSVAMRGVPAGSVIIAGDQCLVTTLTMPTGWWIIGASPTRILTGDPARPFRLDPGDSVTFRAVPRDALTLGEG